MMICFNAQIHQIFKRRLLQQQPIRTKHYNFTSESEENTIECRFFYFASYNRKRHLANPLYINDLTKFLDAIEQYITVFYHCLKRKT